MFIFCTTTRHSGPEKVLEVPVPRRLAEVPWQLVPVKGREPFPLLVWERAAHYLALLAT